MLKLCNNAQILIEQINNRWPDRDIKKDSVQNPYQCSVSIPNIDQQWFCDELIAYAKNNIKGSYRITGVAIGNKVASNKFVSHRWQWYDDTYVDDIFITFSNKNESSLPYDIPILFAKGNQWDGVIPFFNDVELAMQKRSKTTDMYRMACRLSELGFYDGKVLSDGQQSLPVTAIVGMQDFMGLQKQPYNSAVHQQLWKEIRFSE